LFTYIYILSCCNLIVQEFILEVVWVVRTGGRSLEYSEHSVRRYMYGSIREGMYCLSLTVAL
ncbi:hypothetical protein L9F63_020944, partial [Diploptera punctata]